ncbi:MAG: DUF342 domain-containing protein [Lachnospiraceae bacterium]|nr:DUF342 domain-containing protein [Lachnospiraceae bacterium]
MTDYKKMPKGFQGVKAEDSLFDIYDKSMTYVRVTEDDRQAWLYLVPKEDGSVYTKDELVMILNENEVVAGIDEDLLIAMAKKKVYEREIKVAEFVEPVEGKDGYYEYFFDVNSETKKPAIREDGSVDYQSMNMVNNVKKGTVLAKYHPAVEGIPGSDVRGFEVSVAAVRSLPSVQGKGVIKDPEDENTYLAGQDGKVELKNGKIMLNNIHQITGDVDQIIGKIEFFGDVLISGNVEAGTVIRAGKSLTIEGTVEAANLTAGGDIILKRGIQGSQKAKVVCRGDLYADFIEHTYVQAGGNVEANIILNSQIEAEGKVVLTGKKGTLVGGNVHGTKGIDCKELGNDVEVKTIVHAGCMPEFITQQRRLYKEEDDLKAELQELYAELREVENKAKVMGADTPLVTVQLNALKNKKQKLDEKIQACNEELLGISVYIERAKDAKIRVDGNLYKGSIICIDQCRMPIVNNTMFMEYRNISGMIAGSVIVKGDGAN